MAAYLRDYSHFPSTPITVHNYKNVDDDIASHINKINTYRAQGYYDMAARYIVDHPELKDYIIDAVTINTIIEEIYNTQLKALEGQYIHFSSTQPGSFANDDVWLGSER